MIYKVFMEELITYLKTISSLLGESYCKVVPNKLHVIIIQTVLQGSTVYLIVLCGLRFAWADDQLSQAHWECSNRLLIKTSHPLLSAGWVIRTQHNKNHVAGDCCGAGWQIQEQHREQSAIQKMCTQETVLRYTEQTGTLPIPTLSLQTGARKQAQAPQTARAAPSLPTPELSKAL